jgi:hypothetical protein
MNFCQRLLAISAAAGRCTATGLKKFITKGSEEGPGPSGLATSPRRGYGSESRGTRFDAPLDRLPLYRFGAAASTIRSLCRLRRVALRLALVAAGLGGAPAARAELNLRWEAPSSCPDRARVLGQIREITGATLDATDGPSADARITHRRGRFQLVLIVRDGNEVRRRVIRSDSCAALAGAAAVTLALLMRSEAASTERSSEDRQAPQPSAGGALEPAASAEDEKRGEGPIPPKPIRIEQRPGLGSRPPASAAPERARRWALLLRAPVMSADTGLLPRPVLGLGVAVGVRYAAWDVLAVGQLSAKQTLDARGPDGPYGAELQRATGQLWACHGWRTHRFQFAPCIGFALEQVTARGFGAGVAARARRAVLPAPGAGGVVHWRAAESLAFVVGLNVHLELSRPLIVIQELGEVRQLGPVAAGTILGVEWIL